MSAILSGDKDTIMGYVCRVYFGNSGTMLGDKSFDIDNDDNIIIDSVRYGRTSGLYELIFKRIPDDVLYTDADKKIQI